VAKKGHHVLFYDREWSVNPDSASVRQTHELIPPMYREPHDELHTAVPYVPTLGRHLMALVSRDLLVVRGDYIRSIESLMFEIEDKTKDRRVSALEAGVANLAVHALELQLPYIREGLIISR